MSGWQSDAARYMRRWTGEEKDWKITPFPKLHLLCPNFIIRRRMR